MPQRGLVFLQPSLVGRVADDIDPTAEAELFHCTRLVGLDGFDADTQLRRDRLVAVPAGD